MSRPRALVPPMLELDDVWKSYHGVPAVRGLSLRADPGTVTGVLGPNGSGKSTTVRMIVGLLDPSRGVIRWQGTPIQDQRLSYQSLVGYVPEEPRLYAHLTAYEYLSLVGGLHSVPHGALERRVWRYLELFELDRSPYVPLAAFSKGMRQKVLISAALLSDPALVVLDEPNSGLDVASSLVLRTLVATLAAQGKVVIYSSHLLDVVERVCDRIMILHGGRVVAAGTVEELRTQTSGGTLEDTFTSVAVDRDVVRVGKALADVARL